MPRAHTPTPAPAGTLPEMDPKEIGALVKATRKARGLSFRDLAEACGGGRSLAFGSTVTLPDSPGTYYPCMGSPCGGT